MAYTIVFSENHFLSAIGIVAIIIVFLVHYKFYQKTKYKLINLFNDATPVSNTLFGEEFYKLCELILNYLRHEGTASSMLKDITNTSFLSSVMNLPLRQMCSNDELYTKFNSALRDNSDTLSFSRFLDFVTMINMIIDPLVLQQLQTRYFKSLISLGESAEDAPTLEQLELIYAKYPWLWLIDLMRQLDEGLINNKKPIES